MTPGLLVRRRMRSATISRLIAQMKADSSRAIAVTTIVGRLPFRVSVRKRPQSRICAFQAISRAARGAAPILICISLLTRGGKIRSSTQPR